MGDFYPAAAPLNNTLATNLAKAQKRIAFLEERVDWLEEEVRNF